MPLTTTPRRPRIAIAYKNFGAFKGLSHIGLGVSAMQNVRMLRSLGILAEVWPITSVDDLKLKLAQDRTASSQPHHEPLTHLVISAPWIPTQQLSYLVNTYTGVEFAVVSHSNIGFLQADPGAFKLLREESELEQANSNFHLAANSQKLVTWWESTYQTEMLLLPNMYPMRGRIPNKHWHPGTTLRIGCFCAVRPLKNVLTAAAAALEMGVRLRVPELEFWISGGRFEGGGHTVVNAIREMYAGVPRAKMVENNWQSWPQFIKTVGSMDLLLQPSYTESFNMSVADGITQGVPSVVSDAIDWAPHRWVAKTDAASDICDAGIALLHDPGAIGEGEDALEDHNDLGIRAWKRFLKMSPTQNRPMLY